MRIIFATLQIWNPQTLSPSESLVHSDDVLETAQMEIAAILKSWEVVRISATQKSYGHHF
jgi:hypothetical protein